MWNGSNLTCYFSEFSRNLIVQAEEREEQLPYIIVGIALSVIGVLANLHVIIALWIFLEDKHLKFTIYLKSMSMSDLFACLGMFAKLFAEHYICPQVYDKKYVCYITNYFGYVSSIWSMLLIVAISYDRYRHICKPLQTQHSSKITWVICGLSALIALFVSLPVLFLFGNRSVQIDGEKNIIECGISDVVRSTKLPLVFYICFDVFFFSLPISVTLMYMKIRQTVIVGVENRRQLDFAGRMAALRLQQSASGRLNADINEEYEMSFENHATQEKTTKLTHIPILITISLSLSLASNLSIETYNAISGSDRNISRSTFMMKRYGFFGVFLNNIVNPFIYVLNHSKLRSGLRKMYTCKCFR